jgi:chromosome partitioning protein
MGSSATKTLSPRIIAIANQKGGVGKSTTAVSLGAALAEIGHRVLVVDLDPQGNASTGMGIRHEAREVTVYDVLASEAGIDGAVVATQIPGLFAIPSTIDLAGAEIELVSQFSRETRLKKAIEPLRDGAVYDFVILDCPPSLGLLTVNALTAAEELIVPIQCEYYALEGLGQLLRNVRLVQQNINPDLRLSGIVMTMFDPRTKLSEQVVQEVRKYFGDLVYDVIIPRTVRLSEAPGFGLPITVYDPRSRGAESYRKLAQEVASRPPPDAPMPAYDDIQITVTPPSPPPSPPEPEVADEPPVTLPESEDVTEHVAEEVEDVRTVEPAEDAAQSATWWDEPTATSQGEPIAVEGVEEDVWEEPEGPPPSDPPPARAVPRVVPRSNVVVIDEDEERFVRTPEPGSLEERDPAEAAVANIGATLHDDPKRRRWRLFRTKGGE